MRNVYLGLLVAIAMVAGCKSPKGENVEEKRAYVKQMHDDALADLYRIRPAARNHVEGAPGYGVFSNLATQILITRTGHGYGIVHDMQTGKETYMKMAEIGGGLGLKVKDFRAVFVFNNESALRKFVDKGWEFGAEGSAAARKKGEGAGGSEAGSFRESITIYRITRNSVALQVAVTGTKYWKNKELN